jgi:large subunit ribosomal protein L21
MKYAVVEHAGRQFVAAEGQTVEVDRLALQAGSPIEFAGVLLLRDEDQVQVGAPFVPGATVRGTVQSHVRGPKIMVFKYRPKQRYRVRQGHRQALTRVAIESVGLPGAPGRAESASKAAVPARGERKTPVEPRPGAAARAKRGSETKSRPRGAAATKGEAKSAAGAKGEARPAARRAKPGPKSAGRDKQARKPAAKKPAAPKKK